MGKKYIIELPENTHWVQWILESTKDHHPYMDFKQVKNLTPYAGPDMEQVRKEAFEKGYSTAVAEQECAVREAAEKGYQKGLSDAWECARKIFCTSHGELERIFDLEEDDNGLLWVYHEYTASEAIEKLKAYEQEKKEQIQVGDEVIYGEDDGSVGIVTKMKGGSLYVTWADGSSGLHNADGFEKTGKHFPEIAEVLQKMQMKDGDNE